MKRGFLQIQVLFQQIGVMQERIKLIQLNKSLSSSVKAKKLKAMTRILTDVSNHTRSLMENEMSKGQ